MPAEVEAPPAPPTEPIELTTSLADVFDKAFPASTEPEPETQPEPEKTKPRQAKEPAPGPEPEVETKSAAKKAEKAAEPPEIEKSISDILFKEKEAPVPVPEKEEVEPVKEPTPPELKGKTKEHFEKQAEAKFQAEKRAIAAEKRAKEVEAKLAEGDPDAKARIQQLEAERQQYSHLIERANLEMHPRFQAEFVIPRQQLLEQAKTAAHDAGIDPAGIEAALSLRGKAQADKLDELYAEITSPTLRGKIERAVDNIGNLDGRRENVLKNQAVVLKNLQQQEQIQRNRAYEESERVVKEGLKTAQVLLQDKFKVFDAVDDPKFAWWNDRLQQDTKNAEEIMLKVSDPTQMTVAALMAARFPMLHEAYVQEIQARKTLEKELREFKDSEPNLGGGSGKAHTSSEEDEDVPLAQAIIHGLNKAK